MSNKEIITKEFNGVDVAFKNIGGESYVRIDEVAKFCGWTRITKGKEYIRWERVNEMAKTLGCPFVGKGDFIKEQQMYMLIAKANNPKALKFMQWVAEVLTQLRKTGVVITDKATYEAIDFEKKFGKYRIRKTFTNSENLRKDYEQFKKLSFDEWKVKRLSGKDRIKLQEIIFDSIKNRLANTITTLKGSEMLAIQELLTDIKADTLKLSNKTNGGDKASLTKQINKLKDYIPPALENYVCVDIHGMSNNYLFKYDSTLGIVKTSTYKKWINDFITLAELGCVPGLSDYEVEGDVDFSKDVVIYIKYVCLDKFDVSNFDKATIDMIFNRWLGVDDKIVKKVVSEKIGSCSTYEDGKIMYYIKNL